MPEMDGPMTATEIKNLCQERNKGKPYICCASAYTEIARQKVAKEAGMDNYITKPVMQDQMKKILKVAKVPH